MKKCRILLSAFCLTVLCKATAEEVGFPPWPEYYANTTPEFIAFKRDAFRDPAKLKAELLQALPINGRFDFKEFPWFKSTFDVQDEVLRPVLLEIYKEARMKNLDDPNNCVDMLRAKRSLTGLGLCADDAAKQLLLGIASQPSDVMDIRMRALAAYLQASDAEESKTVLLQFLVEGDRLDSMARLNLYGHARTAYDAASPEKKSAILAALIAATNKEEGKIEFMKVDKILAERSTAYRRSRERLAMLERHSLEPPTNNLYTDRDLKAGLAECRKYKAHTSISTNIAALKTRNFNLPLPAGATNELTAPVPAPPEVELAKVGDESKDPVSMEVLVIVLLLAMFGFFVWKSRKSKHQ